MPEATPVIRSVDVGFGNVKYVTRHIRGQEVLCSIFPSVAPQAGSSPDLGSGVLQKFNTVTVDVNGVKFEVGKDAEHAQDISFGRVLDRTYPTTDTYMALLRGALYYMGEPEIDCLVLGLPVNTLEDFRGHLEKNIPGIHAVPNIRRNVDSHADPMMDVNIKSVRVFPQPLGAFFDHAIRNGLFGQMKSQTNLIVDVGYFTTDWLMTHGLKTIKPRSGAHSGGMSAILAAMGEALGRDNGTQLTSNHRLDEAIRNGSDSVRLFGKEQSISQYLPIGKAKAREFLSIMANKVGDGADIDNIILSGGGSSFFRDVLQERFPKHEIVIAKDPVYANVRGFQLAGEEMWVSERVKRHG